MFRYLSEVFVTDESFSEKAGGTTAACPDGIICIAVFTIIIILIIVLVIVIVIVIIIVIIIIISS